MFDWAWFKLSHVTITVGSLNSQDKIRIFKQSRHDFSVKHLCDGYYVIFMYGGQNLTEGHIVL